MKTLYLILHAKLLQKIIQIISFKTLSMFIHELEELKCSRKKRATKKCKQSIFTVRADVTFAQSLCKIQGKKFEPS